MSFTNKVQMYGARRRRGLGRIESWLDCRRYPGWYKDGRAWLKAKKKHGYF